MMLIEHEQGRAFVRALAEAAGRYARGDQSAVPVLIQNGRGYVALLRQHIMKEDNILFMLADRVLSEADQRQLVEDFEIIERDKTGPGEHERYHRMLDQLEQAVVNW
jgi:hemerythrin-like domain-containing protein